MITHINIPSLIADRISLGQNPDWTFWINVALATATLAVTCVTVVVGVAAIIGFVAAKRIIKRNTQKQVEILLAAHLKSSAFEADLKNIASFVLKDHIKDQLQGYDPVLVRRDNTVPGRKKMEEE